MKLLGLLFALAAVAMLPAVASATHLTTITVDQANVDVNGGSTAQFTGSVYNECGLCGTYDVAFSLTGAPAGSTVTFTPATIPGGPGAAVPIAYTVDILVPAGAAGGEYAIVITALIDGGFPRSIGTTLTVFASKGGVLANSGVKGQGIADAPGLQSIFNENSAAADSAGKRDSVEVCHVKGNGTGVLMEVTDKALAGHLSHGDDPVIAGGSDLGTVAEVESNDSIAGAQVLGGSASDPCGRTGGIGSATIDGTGDGTFDYYSFGAVAGQEIKFEILAGNFDTELFLYDNSGALLAENDDIQCCSFPGLFSRITHTFASSGTFTIAVGRFASFDNGGGAGVGGRAPEIGDEYTLDIATQ